MVLMINSLILVPLIICLAIFVLFTNLRTNYLKVVLPKGESTIVTKEGSITLCDGLVLDHVLYVPALTYSLLSFFQLLA